jgi:hypothetical protein
MRRRYLLVSALVVAVAVLWLGVALGGRAASQARDLAIPAAEASAAEVEAHVFWDNPMQRLLYVGRAAVSIEASGSDCSVITVDAYSLFGIRVDSVRVDCHGVSRGVP